MQMADITKKHISIQSRLRHGVAISLVLFVIGTIVHHLLLLLYSNLQPLYKYFISLFSFAAASPWLANIAALALMLLFAGVVLWILGGISPSDLLKKFARWRLARAQERLAETLRQHGEKILYGARIKNNNFLGGTRSALSRSCIRKRIGNFATYVSRIWED